MKKEFTKNTNEIIDIELDKVAFDKYQNKIDEEDELRAKLESTEDDDWYEQHSLLCSTIFDDIRDDEKTELEAA